MFDFAWSEIALIAGVALIFIGPKDMPVAIRSVTGMIKKARRMASEFQTHVDEMVREANLEEVRNQINEIRNFDFRGEIERNIDPDGSLRSTFDTNPLAPTPAVSTPPPAGDAESAVAVAEPVAAELHRPEEADRVAGPAQPEAPPFIPPNAVRPEPVGVPQTQPEQEPEAPAFIPPQVVLQHRPRPSA